MKKEKRKVSEIIKTILFAFFILLATGCVTFSIIAKKAGKDSPMSLFGHQSMIVLTDSMGKCDETDVSSYKIKSIPVKSMVFIENVPENEEKAYTWYSNVQVGDVLTFKYVFDRQVTVTHRVIEIEPTTYEETKGFIFKLMGDNKTSGSNPGVQIINTAKESPNYVIGKVTGQSIFLGNALSFIKTPWGISIFILLPAFGLLIYEVINISRIVSSNRKEKLEGINNELSQTNTAQSEEIERLRKELEQLKNNQNKEETESKAKEDN